MQYHAKLCVVVSLILTGNFFCPFFDFQDSKASQLECGKKEGEGAQGVVIRWGGGSTMGTTVGACLLQAEAEFPLEPRGCSETGIQRHANGEIAPRW